MIRTVCGGGGRCTRAPNASSPIVLALPLRSAPPPDQPRAKARSVAVIPINRVAVFSVITRAQQLQETAIHRASGTGSDHFIRLR